MKFGSLSPGTPPLAHLESSKLYESYLPMKRWLFSFSRACINIMELAKGFEPPTL